MVSGSLAGLPSVGRPHSCLDSTKRASLRFAVCSDAAVYELISKTLSRSGARRCRARPLRAVCRVEFIATEGVAEIGATDHLVIHQFARRSLTQNFAFV